MNDKPTKNNGLMLVSPSPHMHAPSSVRSIMGDVALALVPAGAASIIFFGLRALVLISVTVAGAILSEKLSRRIMKRPDSTGDLSALVTGLLLAYNLPPSLPVPLAILGSVFAIVVAKQVFGGLGYNPFNPALAARAFLLVSFTGAMTSWSAPLVAQSGDAVTSATPICDAVTSATPLYLVKSALKAGGEIPIEMTAGRALSYFLGMKAGSLGETSALAILLGGAYLLIRRVITWHVPVSFIGSAAIYATIAKAVSPSLQMGPVFHVLTGGMLLGAIFMATDMVTSPSTRKGQLVFGCGCGLLTMAIRTVTSGDYPEGVSFAILVMNAFVPLIDRATRTRPYGEAHG